MRPGSKGIGGKMRPGEESEGGGMEKSFKDKVILRKEVEGGM